MLYQKNPANYYCNHYIHISHYYYFQSVLLQPQRAVQFISAFLHLHRPQHPFKHLQRISSYHACDDFGNFVQNGCQPIKESFFQSQFSGIGVTSQGLGPADGLISGVFYIQMTLSSFASSHYSSLILKALNLITYIFTHLKVCLAEKIYMA